MWTVLPLWSLFEFMHYHIHAGVYTDGMFRYIFLKERFLKEHFLKFVSMGAVIKSSLGRLISKWLVPEHVTSHCLKQWWHSPLTHITRPHRVKGCTPKSCGLTCTWPRPCRAGVVTQSFVSYRGICRRRRWPPGCRTEWWSWRIRYRETKPRRLSNSWRQRRSCLGWRWAQRDTLKHMWALRRYVQ